MNEKLGENKENLENRQPRCEMENKKGDVPKIVWDPEDVGVLKIPAESGANPEETRWMQEHHNSGHALWFLSMAVHSIINGQNTGLTGRKAKSALAHLYCLREFIQDKDRLLGRSVENLIEALLCEFPQDRFGWMHFMHKHWYLIRTLAEHYDQHEKCFGKEDYRKLCDIVYGREHVKVWWWRLRFTKLAKAVRHRIRKCCSLPCK